MFRKSGFVLILILAATAIGTAIAINLQEPTPEEAAFLKEQPRLDRLGEIAGQLYDPEANTEVLITEAARLCGFAIWNEKREKIAEPVGLPRFGYAITDDEIKWFALLQKSGHRVTMGSLIDSLDVVYLGLGGKDSCGKRVTDFVKHGYLDKNASVRAWSSFLRALNAQNPQRSKYEFGAAESVLSPVEALFLLRVITEEMTRPVRAWLKTKATAVLYASIEPQAAPEPPTPGWFEDAVAAVSSEVTGQLVEVLESEIVNSTALRAIERYKDITGRINTAMSLIKFIETYATLKCDFKVEDPGQPLIRTTSHYAGEKRTVDAHWYFDAPSLTDWLKEHRLQFTGLGIDPDAPHSGDLADVETDWQIVRGTNSGANQVVQVQVDMSKVKTDSRGVARVEFEGKPQVKDMNRNAVAPVDKIVQLQVTPQVKGTSMGQDVVDALTGALGIKRGGLGWATPLIESIYRLKWFGTKGYKLQVRDWVPGETRGTVTITVHGYGSLSRPNERHWANIDRWVEYRNVVMQDLGTPVPDPVSLDSSTPAHVRQKALEAYNQMLEASKRRPYIAEGPGMRTLTINDSSGFDYFSSECADPRPILNSGSTTGQLVEGFTAGDVLAGNVPQIGIAVSLDLVDMKAVLQVADEIEATSRSASNVTGPQITSERKHKVRLLREVFAGSEGTDVPIQQTQDVKTKQLAYKGHREILFYFGPMDRFRGRCTIDFELIRVPKRTP